MWLKKFSVAVLQRYDIKRGAILYLLRHAIFEGGFFLYEAEATIFGAINKTGLPTLSQLRPSDGIVEAFERLVYPLINPLRA